MFFVVTIHCLLWIIVEDCVWYNDDACLFHLCALCYRMHYDFDFMYDCHNTHWPFLFPLNERTNEMTLLLAKIAKYSACLTSLHSPVVFHFVSVSSVTDCAILWTSLFLFWLRRFQWVDYHDHYCSFPLSPIISLDVLSQRETFLWFRLLHSQELIFLATVTWHMSCMLLLYHTFVTLFTQKIPSSCTQIIYCFAGCVSGSMLITRYRCSATILMFSSIVYTCHFHLNMNVLTTLSLSSWYITSCFILLIVDMERWFS